MTDLQPGPTNSLTDVAGIRVGHADRRIDGWLSGTTVVLAPRVGAVGGVDVRGGGPGTRETDVLDPRNAVEQVHAIVLSGGSAFGLAAPDGVMQRLFEAGIGFPTGMPGEVVPIVPAAVIYDLGRGGDFTKRPGAAMGQEAYDMAFSESTATGAAATGAAVAEAAVSGAAVSGGMASAAAASWAVGPVPIGVVGAGTGAVAGGLKGGVGSASVVLEDGTTLAAIVVVNSFGSCVDPVTGELYAARFGLPGDFPELRVPDVREVEAARAFASARAAQRSAGGSGLDAPDSPGGPGAGPALATTLGVVATDAMLTKAQCAKVSGIAHDGMARAIRPVHTMVDGDTVFTLATGERGWLDPLAFHALLEAAGDCFTRAIGRAMLAATSVQTPAGQWLSYRETFPSAFGRGPGEGVRH
jgi:putative pantetheine hydrolase